MGALQAEVRPAVAQGRPSLRSRALPRVHPAPEEVHSGGGEVPSLSKLLEDRRRWGDRAAAAQHGPLRDVAAEHRPPGEAEAQRGPAQREGAQGRRRGEAEAAIRTSGEVAEERRLPGEGEEEGGEGGEGEEERGPVQQDTGRLRREVLSSPSV